VALVNETLFGEPSAPAAPVLRPVGPPETSPEPPAPPEAPSAAGEPAGSPAAGRPAPPVARWELAPYDLGAALRLESELGIGHVLAQVLVRRGFVDPDAARAFLEPADDHNPLAFDGIEDVCETIRSHIEAGSRIVVHGDYDVDGICATAILIRALRALAAEAQGPNRPEIGWYLPSRERDGYGLAAATVQRLAQRGTGLLITVDCGITAVEEVDAALSAGLDVVITDHHTPRADGLLPSCGIVHPALCDYPCPDLCGSGVAWKLAEALGAPTIAEDLELVAMATVADLVPLRGENRRLVRQGIAALAGSAKPGLRALMAVSRSDPSALDAQAIGFRLAPRINAAGRMRAPDAGLELLLTEDPERAAEIAAELDAVNAERRVVEERIGWEADACVAELGERPIYVLEGADWHPGVIGIVASRIVERYHRPTILIASDSSDPTKAAQGSGRSIPGFDLLGALHAGASELARYGGHRAAAGLTIEPARIPAFRALVEAHAAAVLTPDLLSPVERLDAVASGAQLGLDTAEELMRMEPCGMGNARTRLWVPGARFEDVRTMSEGRHARFSVSSGGTRAQAVAFGCDGKPAAQLDSPLDASFRLERNIWNGAVEPRLVLGHARPCAPAAIEVIGEPDDYLQAVLAELDRPVEDVVGTRSEQRTVLDRRGESPLAVLADALAAGPTLAVCADVPRRLPGLTARTGGFALVAGEALLRDPALAEPYTQIVVLDPPSGAALRASCQSGAGFTHLAWGAAELRFAEQMHELEFGLRTSLVSLYRALTHRQRAAGEELERLLRGDGRHGRSARLAARAIRVMAELELVSLDRALPAPAVALRPESATRRLELSDSAAYRSYHQRYEDGRRFLSSAHKTAAA
jgi:single-stranded-DNA-specific exonuclease